ncbi:hypothetical protein FKM82_028180 [Ascaphus truei]
MYSLDAGLRFLRPKNCLNSCCVSWPDGHSVMNFLYQRWISVAFNSSTVFPSMFPILTQRSICFLLRGRRMPGFYRWSWWEKMGSKYSSRTYKNTSVSSMWC